MVGIEYEILIAELKRHAQARAPITNADETVRDPWDTEWPNTEIDVADTMAKVKIPRETLGLRAEGMVPIGDAQHITREEYESKTNLLRGSAAGSSSSGDVTTKDAQDAIKACEPYKAFNLPTKEEREKAIETIREARLKQEVQSFGGAAGPMLMTWTMSTAWTLRLDFRTLKHSILTPVMTDQHGLN